MDLITQVWRSSLGKKYIMAVTGGALFLFVLGHLLGNLQIFIPDGGEAINAYGAFLQSKPSLVWAARLGLLVMVGLHVWSAARLSIENRVARPMGYAGDPEPLAASYASRTMLMSGVIIVVFIIYHLLHFTVQAQAINLTRQDFLTFTDAKGRHDVFRMMITGFSQPFVSGFYILAMGLLCLHLSHGVGAMFQSMGWKNKVYGPLIDRGAKVAGWMVFLGYASIPAAVLLGYGKEALR